MESLKSGLWYAGTAHLYPSGSFSVSGMVVLRWSSSTSIEWFNRSAETMLPFVAHVENALPESLRKQYKTHSGTKSTNDFFGDPPATGDAVFEYVSWIFAEEETGYLVWQRLLPELSKWVQSIIFHSIVLAIKKPAPFERLIAIPSLDSCALFLPKVYPPDADFNPEALPYDTTDFLWVEAKLRELRISFTFVENKFVFDGLSGFDEFMAAWSDGLPKPQ
jgi:hypothetical protein